MKNFFLGKVSPLPLSFLRIGVAAVLLIQAFFLVPDIFEYYGREGIIQGDLHHQIMAGAGPGIPTLEKIYRLIPSFLPGMSYEHLMILVYLFYILTLFMVLVGQKTRGSAFCCWLLHFILMNSAPATNYGVDRFGHIMLFYFIWIPVAEVWSLDHWDREERGKDQDHPWRTMGLRLLQFHLCWVYFQSGTAKGEGFMWWNGEAIWRSVMSPEYRQFDFSWLSSVPWLAKLSGYMTLAVEAGYPLFIWSSRTRLVWVFLTLGLHAGIALFQGLWIFSLMMMVLTGCIFGIPESDKFSLRKKFPFFPGNIFARGFPRFRKI